MDKIVIEHLGLVTGEADMSEMDALVELVGALTKKVRVALVGKYVELQDAYISAVEALSHAGYGFGTEVEVKWIYSDSVTKDNVAELLGDVDGIVVPGGFGDRGIDGKIEAITYARENNVPFFGIALGMQLVAVEYARNVLGLADAHSKEFNPDTTNPIVHLSVGQKDVEELGGTMRLGLYPCKLQVGTVASAAYGEELIYERHRNRYEFNNEYRNQLEEAGLVFSGMSPDDQLVEILELENHPFFIACHFHPEFSSRPTRPQPLFREFVKAMLAKA